MGRKQLSLDTLARRGARGDEKAIRAIFKRMQGAIHYHGKIIGKKIDSRRIIDWEGEGRYILWECIKNYDMQKGSFLTYANQALFNRATKMVRNGLGKLSNHNQFVYACKAVNINAYKDSDPTCRARINEFFEFITNRLCSDKYALKIFILKVLTNEEIRNKNGKRVNDITISKYLNIPTPMVRYIWTEKILPVCKIGVDKCFELNVQFKSNLNERRKVDGVE